MALSSPPHLGRLHLAAVRPKSFRVAVQKHVFPAVSLRLSSGNEGRLFPFNFSVYGVQPMP